MKRRERMKAKRELRDGWREAQRDFARFFHTIRAGVNKETSSHSLHKYLYLEVKRKALFWVWNLLLRVAESALREDKIPIVGLKTPNRQGFVCAFLTRHWQYAPIIIAGEFKGMAFFAKGKSILKPEKFYEIMDVKMRSYTPKTF